MNSYLDITRRWVEHWVIALNLCPFAKSPFVQGRVRFVLEEGDELEQLAAAFVRECLYLHRRPVETVETTLIVHPNLLTDFADYLDFVAVAEELIRQIRLEGILQVASFHPDYQFAEAPPDAPEHYTNRSPFPMLHLIREESVSRALTYYDEPERIPERNIAKMNELGLEGIRKMLDDILMI